MLLVVFGFSLVVVAALAAAVGPPLPADSVDATGDGDFVEVDGVLYQRKGDLLYTLDDDAVADFARELTITGSNLDKNRKQKIIRAEVIDGDAIRESGARTLADVLEEQGGIQVNSSLGLGAEVFVDGLDGRHVLILIDGRPVNGKVNNRVDVSRLPVDAASIERIEIVRGPMSALYGSEALGGVINIITKKPSADVGGAVEFGGQILPGGTVWSSGGLSGHGGLGPFALRLSVLGSNLPGFDRGSRAGKDIPDGRADVPDRRQGSLTVAATAPVGSWTVDSTLGWSLAQSSSVLAPTAPFRDAADNSEFAVATGVSGGVDVGLVDDVAVKADLRVDRFHHKFKKLPTGGEEDTPAFCDDFAFDPACPRAPNVRTDAQKDEARAEVRADAVFVDDADAATVFGREISASVGAVALGEVARRENDDGEDTLPGAGQRVTVSGYGEALWRPLQWLAFLPGLRVDAFLVDGSGQSTNAYALAPKLAARIDSPIGAGLRASVGRGFRLPSFEERFLRFDHSELGYIVLGNPNLSPEQSTGVRLEAVYARTGNGGPPAVDAGVELGVNLIDNLITEDADDVSDDGIPVFTYRNASRAWTAAVTTRASIGPLPVGPLAFKIDGTWQYLLNAVDASPCPPEDPWLCPQATSLPLRPAHAVDVTGRIVIKATDTVFFVRTDALSERPLVDDLAPAAFILSAGVRQTVFDSAEFVVGFENLLDQTDPVFGPKPGRHISFNLRVWR